MSRSFQGLSVLMLVLLAGCATAPKPVAPLPIVAPTPTPVRVEPARPTPMPVQPTPQVRAPEPKPTPTPTLRRPEAVTPESDGTVLVESEPKGAMIVVNGVPVGRTPKRVTLPVSAQGFSRETVSIKVRFIAAEAGQQSQTMEEVLTPLDKMPSGLVFSPTKVLRK